MNPNELISKMNSNEVASKLEIHDPTTLNHFKETFINILISYFKNNIILLNNLVELSDKIIMKKEDLALLISILIERPRESVLIEVTEDLDSKNCL
jgi:hypothetical protein